jgi:hypothetical protein
MRVLVTGGRAYADARMVAQVLASLPGLAAVGHGAAKGADTLAAAWAARTGGVCVAYPADWVRDGKAAGPIRNARMLREFQPDLLVAFPGGNGTADMVRQAVRAGVPVKYAPQVLNRHRHWVPPSAIYIGRGTPWGNPYAVEQYGREHACALFREHVLPTINLNPLRGRVLLCSCYPAACHGDALVAAANSE